MNLLCKEYSCWDIFQFYNTDNFEQIFPKLKGKTMDCKEELRELKRLYEKEYEQYREAEDHNEQLLVEIMQKHVNFVKERNALRSKLKSLREKLALAA